MKYRLITGAALGSLVGLPYLAILYAGQQIARLPLVPVDLFEWLTRLLPGGVVTLGLEGMINLLHALQLGPTSILGKAAEFALAYLVTLFTLAGFGALYAVTLERLEVSWPVRCVLTGFVLAGLASLLANWGGWGKTGPVVGAGWNLITSLGWGLTLAWSIDHVLPALIGEQDAGRRRALGQLTFGSLALTALAIGLGRWLGQRAQPLPVVREIGTPTPSEPPPTPPPTQAGFSPAPGTRPEITPIDDFYRVDINLLPPGQEDLAQATDNLTKRLLAQGGETDLPASSYILEIGGLVDKPLALDLTAIKSFPKVEQYATLACISNPVGGDLISTTLFQGIRLKDVLERAGLQAAAIDLQFTCVDGYTESLPIASALDPRTLLCYAMGNQPLSQKHGAPIRLYTPDRFGMKNPKWIIKIEAVADDYHGYWEQRGWSEQAWIQTTSVIDSLQTDGSHRTQVGGIAFAGARGVERVELRVDSDEWLPAEVNRPLSPLTWVLWRAILDIPPGEHEVTVRAVDGQGEVQTVERSGTHPDGATGLHSESILTPLP